MTEDSLSSRDPFRGSGALRVDQIMRVLIVDNEPSIRRTLRVALEATGHTVDEAASGPGAVRQAERSSCDVALVDLRLGSESGLDLLETLRQGHPHLAGVVITAHASIATAVEAMRRGAFDFLPKPFTPDQVRAVLERVVRYRGLEVRVADLEERVRTEVPEVEPDSPDPLVQRVIDQARAVAPTEAVVLIRGENGTGKGVLARTLHAWSKRAGGPFVTVSCPSLSPDLLESDLFGHARGAFTDAVRDAPGKVAAAEGEPCSSTRSATCPPCSSRSSCGSSRSGSTSGSARRSPAPPTSGSWPRPTATSTRRSPPGSSVRICCTGST
jgi:NtrC-family two-component system response regulator AlgB